jgi:hypothetical protein
MDDQPLVMWRFMLQNANRHALLLHRKGSGYKVGYKFLTLPGPRVGWQETTGCAGQKYSTRKLPAAPFHAPCADQEILQPARLSASKEEYHDYNQL